MLTEQQSLMVAFVMAGFSNKKIVSETGLSKSTIRNHLRAAYAKMGVTGHGKSYLTEIANSVSDNTNDEESDKAEWVKNNKESWLLERKNDIVIPDEDAR